MIKCKVCGMEKMKIKTFEDVPLGSIVETQYGNIYMYIGKSKDFNVNTNEEYMCLSENGFQGFLSNFETLHGTKINKIYKHYGYGFGFNGCIKKSKEIIWQREEPIKEVTIADIEEKFGCKVKIVKEKTNENQN